jgi:hypothetical protein
MLGAWDDEELAARALRGLIKALRVFRKICILLCRDEEHGSAEASHGGQPFGVSIDGWCRERKCGSDVRLSRRRHERDRSTQGGAAKDDPLRAKLAHLLRRGLHVLGDGGRLTKVKDENAVPLVGEFRSERSPVAERAVAFVGEDDAD